jgi:hypothetical protein
MKKQDWTEITCNGLWPASKMMENEDHRPPNEDQVHLCLLWIDLFASTVKTIHRKASSYGRKHLVEQWLRYCGMEGYVSSGAFTEAARRKGYKIIAAYDGSPHAMFNMSIAKWISTVRMHLRHEYDWTKNSPTCLRIASN